jgi:hypothetical protein
LPSICRFFEIARPRGVAVAFLLALAACGDGHPLGAGPPDDTAVTKVGDASAVSGNPCATPNEGCRCEAYGAVIDCGQVDRRSGKFVSCSLGKRTCSGGRWGACIGDRISGQVESPLPGKSPLALGNQSACLNNPCDPYCVNYVDNASDLDGGDNLTVVDGSLVLIQHEGGTSFTTCTGLVITPGPQTITVVGISPLVTVPDSLAFAAKLSPVGCAKGTVPATWAISNEDIAAVASDGTVRLYVPVRRARCGPLTPPPTPALCSSPT